MFGGHQSFITSLSHIIYKLGILKEFMLNVKPQSKIIVQRQRQLVKLFP